jgi:hypothetical protein
MAEVQQEMEFTEAQLTGEDVSTPETTGEKAEATPEKEVAAAPIEPEPAKETPAAEPVKPPKGYISEGALKEERRIRKELQAKLEALEKTLPPPKDPAALILEDPEEAVRLLMQQNVDLRDEMTRRDMEREIRSEVPDFFDLAPKMEEALLEEGLSEESIRSIIGASGKDAPKLFKVLAKVAKDGDGNAARERIREEITPLITKELMAKFNIVDTGTNIGKLPGSSPDGKSNVDGEKGYAKLTPEQQERWLRGEI